MKTLVRIFIVLVLLAGLTSCKDGVSAEDTIVNMFTLKDCVPPSLISAAALDEYTAAFVFDEEVFPLEGSFTGGSPASGGLSVRIALDSKLAAGNSARIGGTVYDSFGNTTTFEVTVWGLNGNPAVLRINEFTTKGSRNQPDRTELKVMRPGSTAGLVLYDGIPGSYRAFVVLPHYEVQSTSFITVWWCDALPAGVKEREGANINIAAGGGLSENNGIMCLASSPVQGAAVTDCVVWSSKESAQYEGYGTKEVWERVTAASESGWWAGEAVYSGWSTSTRAMALGADGRWYTTVQGGLTFGSENTAAAYKGE